ncbi:chemotaxis protein CheD [Candidatus Enterovibrio escicola]|uniref:Probable chemoreceptor glutamine deamidase CheD n=1 Tax=Candidatus Enterovibrio escicola TaxID=1927127 RepID=A0A2A5T046_9GAMM|nr:chemotaxis protein CheD [Candidatus Enterovibrio escacola]PCS21534.1 Chemotaxis protein CheD [Candidatus Enterovibrio escacola]
MHKILELTGCPLSAGMRRFYYPNKQMMMVQVQLGDVYVTSQRELISTVLGSCISTCIWDPCVALGGMNHFMLPFGDENNIKEWDPSQWRSHAARYGNYAMELLVNTMIQQGAVKDRLRIKLFGGGFVIENKVRIGNENIIFILDYVASEELIVISRDLGNVYPRKVIFDPMTGQAWVKKLRGYYNNMEIRENYYNDCLVNETK